MVTRAPSASYCLITRLEFVRWLGLLVVRISFCGCSTSVFWRAKKCFMTSSPHTAGMATIRLSLSLCVCTVHYCVILLFEQRMPWQINVIWTHIYSIIPIAQKMKRYRQCVLHRILVHHERAGGALYHILLLSHYNQCNGI